MAQLGIENMSAYLRQVAIDGYEEKTDFLNAVSRKIPDSLFEDRLMFSFAGAQPDFSEIVREEIWGISEKIPQG